ncbi:DNA-directed RNA polymerase subunit delta [Bhargavaea beijingensis]|uniref:Probable DNA-directed RNA polymerase subunit delta n=1 Tax=Bhargavaea beijingensis TaxID=426756 RepID=A0A1G7DTB1_9BACL|nr:DNA-directed RNA polymerase subunit delta [Bhargavaea beijingensis]MCW1928909.1 DNA-directed RNA polymerase subunit delta [Bhargavaea beijingensis]SDE54718.1 DNA-directed RNA polymerase subunit delta [Bhargavaea beijingensis]
MNLQDLTQEQLKEEALIDLAFALLEERREPLEFPALMAELGRMIGLSEEETKERLVRFYTDMNIDGRFLALGDGRWALREWYPVDKIEEETAPSVKPRKRKAKAKAVEDDDEEIIEDDEDVDFDEDFDEFAEDDDEEEDFEIEEEEDVDELDEDEEEEDLLDGEIDLADEVDDEEEDEEEV